MKEGRIRANGIEFAYLEQGQGPLLLCLHGFPDNAWSWPLPRPRWLYAVRKTFAAFRCGSNGNSLPGHTSIGKLQTAAIVSSASGRPRSAELRQVATRA